MKKTLLLFSLVLLLWNCGKDKHEVKKSFCFWKTDVYLDTEEDSLSKIIDYKHAYVRYFDVEWNPYAKEASPVASVGRISASLNELTPSVFIKNEVMLLSDKKALDSLAARIARRVSHITGNYYTDKAREMANAYASSLYNKRDESKSFRWPNTDSIIAIEKPKLQQVIHEIMIDCDWTEKSKANYFYFLKQIKMQFPKQQISATIRLWQYKYYEKAGVPPVDRGLLMCYNMGNAADYKLGNSIGSNDELESYLTHSDYKLPLDIALPLFSWSVLFRDNKFKGIISDDGGLVNDKALFKRTDASKGVLQNDMLFGNLYARYGDEVRIEKISDEELKEMIATITDKIAISNTTKVTFFSFDKKYIYDYGVKNIASYYSLF